MYYIAATPLGYVLVFTFSPVSDGLQSVTLISKDGLYSCIVAHGRC